MRGDYMDLNLPVDGSGDPTTGTGSTKKVESYREAAAMFVLTGAASVTVQFSHDGSNWIDVPNMIAITVGTTMVAFPSHAFKFVRVSVVVAYTAGNKVVFGGFDSRKDG